ncbi:major capsid protein [Paracoccus sp. (in: a-proteobacteria)]|uniref:major capsid protein n=1 Tax=Paracoccus sp. TaxID=267 RepID=UPI0032428FBC
MKVAETISTAPISTEKSVRGDEIRALTTGRAGKIIPVSYIPVLREDRVSRGSVRLKLDMAETIHPLMNAVNVTAYVHFVPWLAFERFNGSMDAFNRSYQGIGEPHNNTPIPFFTTTAFNKNHQIWKTLGVHWKNGAAINNAPIEAYNTLVNFRRKARSEKLALRNMTDTTLAEAFWKNSNLWHIVPDFDQAAMDGEVELQVANPTLRISGLGRKTGAQPTMADNVQVFEKAGLGAVTYPKSASPSDAQFRMRTNEVGVPEILAELADTGVRLSLANIELAKQTAAFAKLREKYSGLEDDHIIDLLMEGIRVPDEALKQPILLDKKSTIFGYSERHAMDGASLDMSVTTGETSLDLSFRTPPMNVGGMILITVEIVPEQLYERQKDMFLATQDAATLPNFMRDFLDPEKVTAVRNDFVDVEHSTPSGTFGYAPLNHEWKRSLTRIGGKYYRPNPDTFVEDRQRFWAVEQLNPTLTSDFYLVNNLPHSVFMDTISDPFEILTLGKAEIVGNTVFGKMLEEDGDHYDSVMDQVDQSRIQQ